MDEMEQELRQALRRQPAPAGLKRRLLERREQQRVHWLRRRVVLWQRMAVATALAGVLAGAVVWRNQEQRRKANEAREQVMTALRITGHALNQVEEQLAAHDRDAQE